MKLTDEQKNLLKEGVQVRNLSELKKAIAPFLPDHHANQDVTIETDASDVKFDPDDDTIKRSGTIKATLSSTNKRKLLLQGLEMVTRQQELFAAQGNPADDDAFGGFTPVSLPSGTRFGWVDLMIKRCLDAKRRSDNMIEWQLDDGTFVFDPKSGKLTRETNEHLDNASGSVSAN